MTLKFTWLGHSTVLLESDGHTVIIDPFLSSNPLIELSPDDLNVDYIFLTHAHGDHVGDSRDGVGGDTIALAKRTGAGIVSNFEIGNWFARKGIDNILQGNGGGNFQITDWLSVKFTKAFHSSSFGDGSYGGQPNGFVIRMGGKTVYHAGDTELFGDMAFIGELGIDVAFLPIGDRFTMGVEDSIRAIQLIKPKYVAPLHYNTFPPIVQDAKDWAERVYRHTEAQPIVIDPTNSYTLD